MPDEQDFEDRVLTTFEEADKQMDCIRKALMEVAKRIDKTDERLRTLEQLYAERN